MLALPSLSYDPTRPPHNDPFDRIMICQAKVDALTLVTHDSLIANYGEPCVTRVYGDCGECVDIPTYDKGWEQGAWVHAVPSLGIYCCLTNQEQLS